MSFEVLFSLLLMESNDSMIVFQISRPINGSIFLASFKEFSKNKENKLKNRNFVSLSLWYFATLFRKSLGFTIPTEFANKLLNVTFENENDQVIIKTKNNINNKSFRFSCPYEVINNQQIVQACKCVSDIFIDPELNSKFKETIVQLVNDNVYKSLNEKVNDTSLNEANKQLCKILTKERVKILYGLCGSTITDDEIESRISSINRLESDSIEINHDDPIQKIYNLFLDFHVLNNGSFEWKGLDTSFVKSTNLT